MSANKKPGFIRRSFRALWRFLLFLPRLFLVLSLLVSVYIIATLISAATPPEVPDGAALVIGPIGELVETHQSSPEALVMDELLGSAIQRSRHHVLLETLASAAEDARIQAVVLDLDGELIASPAQLMEIRRAIGRVRAANKPVFAWASYYSQAQYLLASAADEIVLDPLGAVAIEGYAAYQHYLRGALDKLALNVEVFRAGEYKSAVEPLLRQDMSAAARRANEQWLTELWANTRAGLAEQRPIDEADVDSYINNIGQLMQAAKGNAAALAQQQGLVDVLENRYDFEQRMQALVGTHKLDDEDEQAEPRFKQISLLNYRSRQRFEISPELPVAENNIHVVIVDGMMTEAIDQAGAANHYRVIDELNKAKQEQAAAVVLRVNSPGGGIHVAEQIRRAVQRVRAAGIPVVVSMGGVAASGGYWIAAETDRILAEPATITGSIGVFAVLPVWSESLAKLGVSNDGVGTSEIAGWSPSRALPEPLSRSIESSVEFAYQSFLERVMAGRGLSQAEAEALASGRVWSGVAAKNNGLIDAFGGLEDAIAVAAELAELEQYEVQYPELQLSPLQMLLLQSAQNSQDQGKQALLNGVSKRIAQWLYPQLPWSNLAAVQQLQSINAEIPWAQRMRDPRNLFAWCACGGS